MLVVGTKENAEARHRNTDRDDAEQETVPQPIGAVRDGHGKAEGGCPWWNTVELGLDGSVVEGCLNNARGEEGVAVRGDD